jgi:hypothetical protein
LIFLLIFKIYLLSAEEEDNPGEGQILEEDPDTGDSCSSISITRFSGQHAYLA